MSRDDYNLTTGRRLPEGQHDDRNYFNCGCGYADVGDTEERHDAYWASVDARFGTTAGDGDGARHLPFYSEATPSGLIRLSPEQTADDVVDARKAIAEHLTMGDEGERPFVVDCQAPTRQFRYVGDDDHAPANVDRGGYQWGDADQELGHTVVPVNPKDAAQLRDKKPPLDLLEREANEAVAWVMQHGAEKYGRQNYLTIDIRARIYAAAVMRHAQQFLDGEDQDADSGLSHWAHIGANVHVFLAALAAGKVVDDRGPAPRTAEQEERSEVSNHGRTV